MLKKKITVFTNDPMKPKIFLTISGEVEKFATIIPKRVSFIGVVGQKLRSEVRIIPDEKYPFRINEIISIEPSNIRNELREIKTDNGIEYVVLIENLKTDKGYYNEVLQIITDSDIRPKIRLNINGVIREKPSNGAGSKNQAANTKEQ